MKRLPFVPSALFVLCFVWAPLAAAASAEADFQALTAAVAAKLPPSLTTGAAQFHWREQQANRLNDLCEKFMADHPADPRRWEAALLLFSHPRVFVKSADDAKLDQQEPGQVIIGAVTYEMDARAKRAEWLAALTGTVMNAR